MTEPIPQYVFKAKYLENHDGDNATLALDHGKFPKSKSVTEAELRIKGLFCPELDEPGGFEARDFVGEVLFNAKRITVQTYKGSFERTISDVWVDGELLSDLVVDRGLGSHKDPKK